MSNPYFLWDELWQKAVQLDPSLIELEQEALNVQLTERYGFTEAYLDVFKDKVYAKAGWGRDGDGWLTSSKAYDVVAERILHHLWERDPADG